MSQKVPVKGFKWKRNVPKFNEKIIKNYDEDSKKESIFEADNEKIYMIYPVIYHFSLKEWKYKNAINLYEICMIKKRCCSHKSFKTSIKLWISTKISAYNSV